MAIYKTTQGRLINDNKEWVWNGESYDYVQSHPEWLPLVFRNDSDAKKFEQIEKEWKAEQTSKSKNKQESMLANAYLKNRSSKVAKHSDNTSYYMYGSSLMHFAKGSERSNHKYIDRIWKNGAWQYIYDKIGIGAKQDRDAALNRSNRDYKLAKEADEDVREYLFKDSANYRRLQNNSKEKWKQAIDSKYLYQLEQTKYDKTILGKIEKGMNIINNLFNKKK